MNDEYSDQDAGGKDLDEEHSSGRTVADLPPTGDPRVDEAVAELSRLAGTAPDEHVAILEEVHGRLRDILGEVADAPQTPEGHEQR